MQQEDAPQVARHAALSGPSAIPLELADVTFDVLLESELEVALVEEELATAVTELELALVELELAIVELELALVELELAVVELAAAELALVGEATALVEEVILVELETAEVVAVELETTLVVLVELETAELALLAELDADIVEELALVALDTVAVEELALVELDATEVEEVALVVLLVAAEALDVDEEDEELAAVEEIQAQMEGTFSMVYGDLPSTENASPEKEVCTAVNMSGLGVTTSVSQTFASTLELPFTTLGVTETTPMVC